MNRLRPIVLADIFIKTHEGFSQHFGHRTLGTAPRHLHLKQTILRHHIAVAVKKTVRIVGVNMRHAVVIANDLDLCRGGICQSSDAPAQRQGSHNTVHDHTICIFHCILLQVYDFRFDTSKRLNLIQNSQFVSLRTVSLITN
ncbi:hypothetical protein D3C85_1206100 [compost metagenome]